MGESSALLRIEVKQIGSPTILEIRRNGQKHTIKSYAVDLKTMREDLRDHIEALKTWVS